MVDTTTTTSRTDNGERLAPPVGQRLKIFFLDGDRRFRGALLLYRC